MIFDTQGPAAEPRLHLAPIDSELLTSRFLAAGRHIIELQWEEFGPLKLGVEDDVTFLCDAYAELAEFVERGGEHRVYLGDGELHSTAVLEAGTVRIVCLYTPYLNRALTKRREYSVSIDAYVAAWDRLMDAVSSAPDP